MMDLEEAARRLNDQPVVDMRSPDDVIARGDRYRRRRTAKIVSSATVAAALVVTVVVVGARSSTQHHSVTVVATTATPARQRSSNEARADRVAVLSLAEIVVPDGAQPWTTAPPAVVAKPAEYMDAQPSLMRHRIWSAPVSVEGALDFLRAHTPMGGVPFEYSGGIGTSGGAGGLAVRFLQYWSPIRDPAIAELELNISVAKRSPHSAWIRADVQAIYRPERPSDEYVGAHDVVVRISQTSLATRDDHKPPSPTVVVNNPTDIRRLRDAINGLRTIPVGPIWGCPPLSGNEPEYILAFQRSATSAPDFVATTQNFCVASTSVSVHGQSRPILEAGDLPTLAANLLQRHVTRAH